jgi:[protein-PII] uridylyltransferase
MKSTFDEFKEQRNTLISDFTAGKVTHTFTTDYTEIIDQYFRISIQENDTAKRMFEKKVSFAFISVGGYGRKEMCLQSDIDILVLFNRRIPAGTKELIEEVFYPLWDLGLELGNGVRTINDCQVLAKQDFEMLTSMMDARFICGDSRLYLLLMEALHEKVIRKRAHDFRDWLKDLHQIRMEISGDASHLLEPDLKNGIGGLRDYHQILWLAKAFFNLKEPKDLEYTGKLSAHEYQDFTDALQFALLTRNHLHQSSGRKKDTLSFEYQEEIARKMGFKDRKKRASVEYFLGRLHSNMELIKVLNYSFINAHIPSGRRWRIKTPGTKRISKRLCIDQNELNFISAIDISSMPHLLLEIFEKAASYGLPLSIEARRLVRDFLYLVDEDFRNSKKAVRSFLNILNHKSSPDILNQMFETGLLDVFIPEFGQIKDLVQFDAYHLYPAGRHVLETVKCLKMINSENNILLLDILSDLPNQELLLLAGLFHDIGKTGKDHAKRGAVIAKKILKRFSYPEKATEEILFLIRHHLILVEIATRRDLYDEKVIVQCARAVGDINRLKYLYLLTWADSKATGPRAWNEWTGNLVLELFFKVLHILERGELAAPGTEKDLKRKKNIIKKEMSGIITKEELEKLFEDMPSRYLLHIPPPTISRHIKMLLSLNTDIKAQKKSPFRFEVWESNTRGIWDVSFVSEDRPGLFSDIAGAMALNNINIFYSDIYTWRDGTAVDIFSVSGPLDSIHPEETWNKITADLSSIFQGKLALSYRLNKKAKPGIISTTLKIPTTSPKIILDNEESDFFTLIEVYAEDRVGLLYTITSTLFEFHLDIRIAKIGTKNDQVADVFYVRDLDGQKIEDEDQVKEIKEALMHKLERER